MDFQDGLHGGHPGFPFVTILAIIDLQVNPKLPTEFQVNWPFDSRDPIKLRQLAFRLRRRSEK